MFPNIEAVLPKDIPYGRPGKCGSFYRLFLGSKIVQEVKELVPKICPEILEDDRANQ